MKTKPKIGRPPQLPSGTFRTIVHILLESEASSVETVGWRKTCQKDSRRLCVADTTHTTRVILCRVFRVRQKFMIHWRLAKNSAQNGLFRPQTRVLTLNFIRGHFYKIRTPNAFKALKLHCVAVSRRRRRELVRKRIRCKL